MLHISKLVAFYTASRVYERARGGPTLCVFGGMRGTSLHDVVHTVHNTLDLAQFRQVVEVLTDPAKYFHVIAPDVHLVVGDHIRLGNRGHLSAHTHRCWYTMLLE